MATYYRPSDTNEFWTSIPVFTISGTWGTDGGGLWVTNYNFLHGSYKRWQSNNTNKAYGYTQSSTWTPSVGGTIYSGSTHTLQQITAFTLTVQAGANGTVSGGGIVLSGANASISATASSRHRFKQWQDGVTTNPRTVNVTQNATYTAEFERSEYQVTLGLTASVDGRVSLNNGAWITSGTVSAWVAVGATCTIKAESANGHGTFLNWNQSLGSASTVTFTPTADISITAAFATVKLTTASNNTSLGNAYVGSTNLSYKFFAPGTTVTIRSSITNSNTTAFRWWTIGGTQYSILPAPSVVTGSSNETYTAVFALMQNTITVLSDSDLWGSAKIWEGEVDRGTSYTAPNGTWLTLKAVPKLTETEIGMFLGWYDASNTLLSSGTELSILSNGFNAVTYTAKFAEAESYDVTLIAGDGDPDTVGEDDPPYAAGCRIGVLTPTAVPGVWYGGSLQIAAVAAPGWHLGSWGVTLGEGNDQDPIFISEGDTGFGSELNFFLMGAVTVEAVFVVNTYMIAAEIDAPSQGYGTVEVLHSATEGGTYESFPEEGGTYGTFAKLTATPTVSGGVFRGWFLDGVKENDSLILEKEIVGDATYVAKFGGSVDVEAVGDAGGTAEVSIDGGETYGGFVNWTYGDTVIIRATDGVVFFRKWYSDTETLEAILEYGPSASFMPLLTVSLKALFDDAEIPVYVKLTNAGASSYGNLMLSGDGITQITEESYESALKAFYGEAGTLGAFGTDLDGRDRFFKLDGARYVQSLVTLLQSLVASFSKWRIKYNTARLTYGTEFDLSEDQDVFLMASAHCVLTASYDSDDPVKITVRHAAGSTQAMGTFSLTPPGTNPQTGAVTQGDFPPRTVVVATAIPANGHVFSGWYAEQDASNPPVSTLPEYTFTVAPGISINLYAKFIIDTSAVHVFEGGLNPKTMTWRSRRYVLGSPFNMVCMRIDADKYPVLANLRTASSPDADESRWAVTNISIESGQPRRLPRMRNEKNFEIELLSPFGIVEVVVSTSMQGLMQ
jgi:hypothetical protein